MSFHHYNRLLGHWQPKKKPDGQSLAYGSKERYESLTPGAKAVALFVAGHLNTETNCYPISQKTIQAKLGLTKATISKALDELVAWGVLYRQRSFNEKPYEYYLAIECPEDCENLESHNTRTELAMLPKKQATPSPKNQDSPTPKTQASGGLENRQLIETNKELIKERDIDITQTQTKTSCSLCQGYYEVLTNGSREIIHSHDCPQLEKIKQNKAWEITQSEIGWLWENLDNREQQIANYISLGKYKERVAKKVEDENTLARDKEFRFQRIIARVLTDNGLQSFTPSIHKWLEIVYKQRGDLENTFTDQAVKYQKLGWHLKPDGDWREGKWIHADSFIESEGSNA